MIRACIASLLLAGLSAPALANDPRLVELEYDPSQIVKIDGKARVQATIRFDENEKIENVAIGDSQLWQVTPNKRANLLFVKPLQANAVTNMTVVTSRRTYLFDLVASPRSKPVYVVSFTYPDDQTATEQPTQLAQQEAASPDEMTAARDPLAVVDPAALNFAWSTRGDKKLLPERTYDDGEATFLTWPAGTPVPAILIADQDGTEGPVNFTVRGETVIVDGVPSEIILRSGRDRAVLTFEGTRQPSKSARSDAALAHMVTLTEEAE